MTTATVTPLQIKGGAFLIEDRAPHEIFTAEDLNEEHLAIARTVDDFWANDVEPHLEAIRQQKPGVALEVLRKSAELGLAAIPIPERFGGMEMDLPSVMIAGEHLAKDTSYASWHSGHTGIGTLPVLFFGNEEQKRKYLPRLAKVELLAAYALTEPLAGSDALAVRTRADLTPDGKFYVLNGQKMWITNGGAADLFTVFAKVGGEKFTAFLVERSFPGVTSGAEEHKMGIKGSSTTAVFLDNVRVPVENVLGEIGRGHIIAFNILNIGRLKLGPGAVGGAKNVLAICLKYAKERKAFGSAIAEFGAIRHKLAEMAIRTYAVESMVWRVVGLIESQLAQSAHEQHADSQSELKAVEEYAAECSMIKVYASEMLDYVVDEGVQIHGGYGYHQDYAVERAYRDSRINRIFEGTNEINRLLITGMLLKRAARGQLALIPAVQAVVKGIGRVASESLSTDEESRLVHNAKNIALFTIGIAYQKYGTELEKQQEILMNISDIVMEVFAVESSLLRSRKLAASGKGTNAADMCAVFLREAMDRIEISSRNVIGACSNGNALRENMAALRGFANYDPIDAIALRRNIASRLLRAGSYTI
ncbi:MAG TPA: acyl-CoA dehydrogenase family protein [Candidatus Eremiobacteraceae bacterium]|nr:acyl-CoA dehydrogenase family protein [Candidatus Eremiobacteraceae bacterium]